MGQRALLAAALAIVGALLLAFATLPPGLAGHGVARTPIQAEVIERLPARHDAGAAAVSTIRYRYVVDGQPHHAAFAAPDATPVASGSRHVGDLREGDAFDVWIDPTHPGAAALSPESPIGPDGVQILMGLALLASSMVFAITRRRRRAVVAA